MIRASIVAAALFGLLPACQEAVARPIIGPDGTPMLHVSCGSDQGRCYELAGQHCQSGYAMLPTPGENGNYLVRCVPGDPYAGQAMAMTPPYGAPPWAAAATPPRPQSSSPDWPPPAPSEPMPWQAPATAATTDGAGTVQSTAGYPPLSGGSSAAPSSSTPNTTQSRPSPPVSSVRPKDDWGTDLGY